MSNILTREEFKSKVKTVARRGHDQVPAWDAVLDCDAALRACIQQAVLDVEKLEHFDDCRTQLDKCRLCGEEFDAHPNDIPGGDICEEFAGQLECDCPIGPWKAVAIANLKKGLGEKL